MRQACQVVNLFEKIHCEDASITCSCIQLALTDISRHWRHSRLEQKTVNQLSWTKLENLKPQNRTCVNLGDHLVQSVSSYLASLVKRCSEHTCVHTSCTDVHVRYRQRMFIKCVKRFAMRAHVWRHIHYTKNKLRKIQSSAASMRRLRIVPGEWPNMNERIGAAADEVAAVVSERQSRHWLIMLVKHC